MKKIVLMMLIGVIFPINASALTGNIELNCGNEATLPDSSVTCTIRVSNFDDVISSFHAKLLLGEGLELESIEKDSGWEGSAEGGIIDLYTDVNKSGDINISTFVVKINSNIAVNDPVVSLAEIKVGDKDFSEHRLDNVETKVDVIIDNIEEEVPDIEETPDTETIPDLDVTPDDSTENNVDNTDGANEVTNPVTGRFKVGLAMVILFGSLGLSLLLYKRKVNNI